MHSDEIDTLDILNSIINRFDGSSHQNLVDRAKKIKDKIINKNFCDLYLLKDQLLECRGLKNRDKYFDSLNRSYIKGKN